MVRPRRADDPGLTTGDDTPAPARTAAGLAAPPGAGAAGPQAAPTTGPAPRPDEPAVHSRTAALALLVLLSVAWGFHWVVVKIGLESVPPFTYAAIRMVLAIATSIVLVGIQGRLRLPPRSEAGIILSVGVLQIAGGALFMNIALQVVNAGRSSVLQYTMPLWVAVALALFFRVRPRTNELVGVALGVTGILFLLNPAVIDWTSPGELAGSLLLIGNAMLWAGVMIHIRRHRWILPPFDLQPWQLLAGLVPIGLGMLVFEPAPVIAWSWVPIACLLFSGVVATSFATWASQSITRSLGSQASATGFLLTPVVGLVSGWLVLGEELGALDLAGFGLVLAGIAATSLVTARPAPAPAR